MWALTLIGGSYDTFFTDTVAVSDDPEKLKALVQVREWYDADGSGPYRATVVKINRIPGYTPGELEMIDEGDRLEASVHPIEVVD